MPPKKDKIVKKKLTHQQEFFCQLYATEREFFGNGTQSYIEAYGINLKKKGAYQTAKACAYENLTKPYINDRINELMENCGLSEANLDKQLAFLVTQNAELGVKVRAISEANKLKGRIIEKKDLTTKGDKIEGAVINVSLEDRISQLEGKDE